MKDRTEKGSAGKGFGLIWAAASHWRSLLWLLPFAVAGAALRNPFVVVAGLGVYAWRVQGLLGQESFQAAHAADGTLAMMQGLLKECAREHRWVGGKRAARVWLAANRVFRDFAARPEAEGPRQMLAEQGLRLARLHLRATRQWQQAVNYQPVVDTGMLRRRLQISLERLQRSLDAAARRDLEQAVEIDRRHLEELSHRQTDLERQEARLLAIESALDAIHRRLTSPEAPEPDEEVSTLLAETEALDAAISEVNRPQRTRAHR